MKLLNLLRVSAFVGLLVVPVAFPVRPAMAQKSRRAKANFVSKKHKFAMYLPVKPTIRNRSAKSVRGATITSFSAISAPVIYKTVVVNFPPTGRVLARANYFEMMQKVFIEENVSGMSNARLVGSRDSIVNGRRTRDIIFTCALQPRGSSQSYEGTIQALIFKEGEQLYLFSAIVPTSMRAEYLPEIHRVLGSVRVYK